MKRVPPHSRTFQASAPAVLTVILLALYLDALLAVQPARVTVMR